MAISHLSLTYLIAAGAARDAAEMIFDMPSPGFVIIAAVVERFDSAIDLIS